MSLRSLLERARDEERGGVLVMTVIWLPVLILFVIFAVDTGNWFLHKKHLQLQADAGVFAGAGVFQVAGCNDGTIAGKTRQYSGDPNVAPRFNDQVKQTAPANVHVLLNSAQFWNQGGTDNSAPGASPCSSIAFGDPNIDVKITEANLPWFFGIDVVPAINAHARIQIQQLTSRSGVLPIGVPDNDPVAAEAIFVNEANGTAIATTPLQKGAIDPATGEVTWDNSAAPVLVDIPTSLNSSSCPDPDGGGAQNTACIGVRISLSGSGTTTCGTPLVECYDLGSNGSYDANDPGILFIRGWNTSGTATQARPILRWVELYTTGVPGRCTDPGGAYFLRAAGCRLGVRASIDFGATFSPVGPTVSGRPVSVTVPDLGSGGNQTVDCPGNACQMTYNSGSGYWETTSSYPLITTNVPGPIWLDIGWTHRQGNQGNTGTFNQVHRTFVAYEPRSGPIREAFVSEVGFGTPMNSVRTDGATPGHPHADTLHQLVVSIKIKGSLRNAADTSDPVVLMRVTGSQNQAVDCDPNVPNLRDEIRQGCGPFYEINTGTPCPAYNALWGTAQPWYCVNLQTGGAVGQVGQGMRDRVHGVGANGCVSPNWWANFPNLDPNDPRIVPVFLTPFGTFTGTGNDIIPVQSFATFYVTGWGGSGQSPDNCGAGDPGSPSDSAPQGFIIGHFIKYVNSSGIGGGGQACVPNAFGSCVAVLVD